MVGLYIFMLLDSDGEIKACESNSELAGRKGFIELLVYARVYVEPKIMGIALNLSLRVVPRNSES